MVTLETVQESIARIAGLPPGLVVLFVGATSGIGQTALQQFAQYASAPRIYSVARPQSATAHERFLDSLRDLNPSGTYTLIEADVSLLSDADRVAKTFKEKETKLDILFLSAGFMAFEGRKDTKEGLEPSLTTRYYSRLRIVQQLISPLNNASSPRIVSVLAGGLEAPLNEDDLGLDKPGNWSTWNAGIGSATMGTLAFERLTHDNPRLSIVHSFPGTVATPGLARSQKFGLEAPNPITQEEGGKRALFLATNNRYSVDGEGLVPIPEGLEVAKKSAGGIFVIDPEGESTDNERVLGELRNRGVDEKVWKFTEGVFAKATGSSIE